MSSKTQNEITLSSEDVLTVEFAINYARSKSAYDADLIDEWSSYAMTAAEAREQREKLTRWLKRGNELRRLYKLVATPNCDATIAPAELPEAVVTAIQDCGYVATSPRHRRIGLVPR